MWKIPLPKWFKRRLSTYPPEDDYWFQNLDAYRPTVSGVPVDEPGAVKYMAVFSCIGLISGDVARLPLFLYQNSSNGGKVKLTEHPLYDLLHSAPNDEMTKLNWLEAAATHTLLWGNHYSQIIRDTAGRIVQIYPLPNPGAIEVYRARRGGEIRYRWHNGQREFNVSRETMLHVPGWGFNGLVGQSVIGVAREGIGRGLAGDEFASRFFSNSATPSGILSMPPEARMDEESAKKYLDSVKSQITSLGKSHTIMMVRNGETYQQLTMPLKDAQFLESREFQKIEVCGMYRVPPHKIAIHGQNSNYNNLEQENQSYVDSCLIHWLSRYEQCFNQQLLTPAEREEGLFFEFLVDGLLRGDSESRAKFYTSLWQLGAITSNEIRALENMNPLPDEQNGDETMVPLNFIPAKDAGKIPDNGQGLPNTEEPAETEENSLRSWAETEREKRIQSEKRSISARDRIARQYRPLILGAAQTVVNKETKAVKFRAGQPTDEWLDTFYQDFASYIEQKIAPVLRSYAGLVADVAAGDTGADFPQETVQKWLDDYVRVYVVRHVASSTGQLASLGQKDGAQKLIEQRADEWYEKRAGKIAARETVQASNGVYQVVANEAGYSTVFRNRGPKTCPYCVSLNGLKIKSGKNIFEPGDELQPPGVDSPMTFRSPKSHPPIHQGCDCYITIGA